MIGNIACHAVIYSCICMIYITNNLYLIYFANRERDLLNHISRDRVSTRILSAKRSRGIHSIKRARGPLDRSSYARKTGTRTRLPTFLIRRYVTLRDKRRRPLRRRSYPRGRAALLCICGAQPGAGGHDYITGRGDPSILGERHVSPISTGPGKHAARKRSYITPAQSGSSLVVGIRTSYLAPGTDLQSSPFPLSLSLALSFLAAMQSSIEDWPSPSSKIPQVRKMGVLYF